MMTSANLINAIESLNGATVNYFGDNHKIDDTCDALTINIVDILRALDAYEVDLTEFDDMDIIVPDIDASWDDDFNFMDDLESLDIMHPLNGRDGYNGYNTYNWSAPLNHDFDYRIFSDYNGGVYIFLQVHRFGDVRGNYSGFTMYYFNSECEFFEVVSECDKYSDVDVDGVIYNVAVRWSCDTYEVFDADGDYICEAYGDVDDVINCIREAIA